LGGEKKHWHRLWGFGEPKGSPRPDFSGAQRVKNTCQKKEESKNKTKTKKTHRTPRSKKRTPVPNTVYKWEESGKTLIRKLRGRYQGAGSDRKTKEGWVCMNWKSLRGKGGKGEKRNKKPAGRPQKSGKGGGEKRGRGIHG